MRDLDIVLDSEIQGRYKSHATRRSLSRNSRIPKSNADTRVMQQEGALFAGIRVPSYLKALTEDVIEVNPAGTTKTWEA
jgi:hypothetical protein